VTDLRVEIEAILTDHPHKSPRVLARLILQAITPPTTRACSICVAADHSPDPRNMIRWQARRIDELENRLLRAELARIEPKESAAVWAMPATVYPRRLTDDEVESRPSADPIVVNMNPATQETQP
jgi:hypothetical protein